MRHKSTYTICLMLIMVMFLSLLPIRAEGLLDINASMFSEQTLSTEEGLSVFENISPFLMNSLIDLPVDDFEVDAGGWKRTYDMDTLSIVHEMEIAPYRIFEGEGMLRLRCDSEKKQHTIQKKFDTPINADDKHTFCLTVNTEETCTLSISLIGDTSTLTKTISINAQVNTGIAIDISSFAGKGSITDIVLRVKFDGDASTYDLYLDSIGFCTSGDIASIVSFMTADYIAGGGNLTSSDESMTFLMAAEGAYVETVALNYRFDEAANAICVKLANFSNATSLTLYYATEETPQYKSINSYTLDLYQDSESHYYFFPLRERKITQIRLVFGGDAVGLAHIYRIEPFSVYSHIVTNYGTLDSVEISENKNDIVIRGTIDDDILEIYKDQTKPIALYCLDPGDDETDIITLATSKISQTDLGKSFKFVIPIEGTDYSRIHCKFAVGITTENGITLIDDCKYVTNPDILSEYAKKTHSLQNKKGIEANAYTADLLCANAYIEIDLSRLISEKESDYGIESYGKTTYFDATYLAELDSQIESYHSMNVAVTATLFQSDNVQTALVNMSDKVNVTSLHHTITYLTHRYSGERNVITDYVIDIENAFTIKQANTIGERIKNTADYLRVIYNSAVSVNASVDIYMMVGADWDKHLAYDAGYQIGSRQLIDTIGSFISAEGDFPWNVAVKLDIDDNYAFNEKRAETSYDSKIISIKNMDMLCRYLELDANLYDGRTREIIVIDQNLEPMSERDQNVDYIYSYIRILAKECSTVKRYIVSCKEYSSQLLDIIRYIDTSDYFDKCSQCALEVIGIDNWGILSIGETDNVTLRTVMHNSFSDRLEISPTGSYTVFDFSSPKLEDEWKAYANCSVISTGNQSIDHSSFLSALLLKEDNFDLSGIVCDFEYVMDFSAAPYLTLELQITGDSLQVDQAEIVIAFFSDDHCAEYSGSVVSSEWNHLTLDLSNFKYCNRITRIRVILKNDQLPTNATLMMGNVIAHSERYSEEEIGNILNASKLNNTQYSVDITLVIILVSVIVFSGSTMILHLLSMNKKKSN